MKVHHRDALATAFIGLTCGVSIGVVLMSYLYVPIKTIAAIKESANWVAAIGTWLVGISATTLTVLQILAGTKKDRFERARLAMERQANADRLAAEAEARRIRERRDDLHEITQYNVAIARFLLPREYLTSEVSIVDLTPQLAGAFVRMIVGAIPSNPLLTPKALVGKIDPAAISLLDISATLCKSFCQSFLETEKLLGDAGTGAVAGQGLKTRLSEISIAAEHMGEHAASLMARIKTILASEFDEL